MRGAQRLSRGAALAFAGVAWLNAACANGPASPAQPSGGTDPVNLVATWSGPASDSSGPGQIMWQITESGASFSGTFVMTDADTGLGGRGIVSGTISGAAVRFSMSVPEGGFDSPYASCTATLSGSAEADSLSITGTYAGQNSCSGAIGSGQLTLNKR